MVDAMVAHFRRSNAFAILNKSQGFFTQVCELILKTDSVVAFETLATDRRQELLQTFRY